MLRAILTAATLLCASHAFAQELTAAQRDACLGDYEKYCKSVVPGGGRIPRADVAAIIASLLETGAASRTQFEVVSGDEPIAGALSALG